VGFQLLSSTYADSRYDPKYAIAKDKLEKLGTYV
jgi:hypothetical protein